MPANGRNWGSLVLQDYRERRGAEKEEEISPGSEYGMLAGECSIEKQAHSNCS